MNMREFSDALAKAVDAMEGKDAAEERMRLLENRGNQAISDLAKTQQQADSIRQSIEADIARHNTEVAAAKKELDEAHEAHKTRQAAFDEQSRAQAQQHGETLDALHAQIRDAKDELADVTSKTETMKAALRAAAAKFE